MRLDIYVMLSIWFVAVAAFPSGRRRNPNSWESYDISGERPPFPPPDIGPLYLPKGYLDDYPLSQGQKKWIRQKNVNEHKRHQKEIVRQWRRTGKRPTDQERKNRAQEIRAELKTTADRYIDPRVPDLKRRTQRRTSHLEALRARELFMRNKIQEAEQRLRDAQTSIENCKEEAEKVRAQIKDLRAKQTAFKKDSQEYQDIEKQIAERRERWRQLGKQRIEAQDTLRTTRKFIKTSNTQIKKLGKGIAKLEGEIQELTKQLEAFEGSGSKTPETEASTKSEPAVEDQTQDRGHFSMVGLENGARQWLQGVGGVLQEVNRRLSTEEQAAMSVPSPFAGASPKPGLILVP